MSTLPRPSVLVSFVLLSTWSSSPPIAAQGAPVSVIGEQKISATEGGFTADLDDRDFFGESLARLGDFDGDGIDDLVVGCIHDDDGDTSPYGQNGAVYLLMLNADGTVKSWSKISNDLGGLQVFLEDNTHFGIGVTSLGDMDGDDVTDIMVGFWHWDPEQHGAVITLFLNPDGTVKDEQLITPDTFLLPIEDGAHFGTSLTTVGDINGDGVADVLVGARGNHELTDTGEVFVVALETDGTAKNAQRITNGFGGFSYDLQLGDYFGQAAGTLGDLDGDGIAEVVVGAFADDTAAVDAGAVYVLFLDAVGQVTADVKITEGLAGFGGDLDPTDGFGIALDGPGDLDGDGVPDLVVGANGDDDGGLDHGTLWVLFLNPDGTVKSWTKINETTGGFVGPLDDTDELAFSAASIGDLDGDGNTEFAVGSRFDDDGQMGALGDVGAVWILFSRHTQWNDLGAGLAGTLGTPSCTATGSLLGGAPITVTLDGALPDTTAFLVAGVAELNAPFKGGTLVPDLSPPGFFVPLPTGPAGSVSVPADMPAGVPPSFPFYLQWWVVDPGGAAGFAASNAREGVTP